MTKANDRKERGSALEKALRVLEAVADQPQPVGLPDVTARVGLPRQTVHRVLLQLEMNGLVLRDPSRDRFAVGPQLTRLALKSLYSANQGAPLRSILQELVDDIQETCNVGVLDGLEFVYLERIECDWSLRVHLTAGSRVPAYCVSGGKVLLGHLPDELRSRMLRSARLTAHTDNTITKGADLEKALREVRKAGDARNDEEFSVGIGGLGVPILDGSGQPVAALALHAPVARLNVDGMLAHLPKLQGAAKRLAKAWRLDGAGSEPAG
ncbi:MAG: IclR family transcriptional regulator [Methyloligellaceae bacterium]